jgi:hypothetical protein
MTRMILAGLILVFLGGCASTADYPCGEAGDYMNAQTRSPLVIPGEMEAASGQRQIRIPEGADVVHPELRGQQVMTEDGGMHCLDRPPPRRGLAR